MNRFALAGVVLSVSCAKIVAPSGGPVDDVPPELISIQPEPGYTEELPSRITITFSEKIQGTDGSVTVYPGEEWEVETKGSEVSVTGESGGDLVMITLPATLEDLRGNSITSPRTLVWNTVPADSFAEVTVNVFRDGSGGVTSSARCDFFLYPDTSSPEITRFPDTLGVVNADWLYPGDYRVVCYEDVDMSRRWDPDREPGYEDEISLQPGSREEMLMTMTIVDSIGPRISQLVAIDGWHIELLWNEQISPLTESGQKVTVIGPDSLPVTVYGLKASQGRSSTGRVTVYTDELSDTVYTIAVSGIKDLAGNPSLPDTLEFWAVDSLPGTQLAVQSAYPEDGGVDVPPAGPFYISFTDWVDEAAAESLYTVTRVADSTVVAGEFTRTSATAFSFIPERELLGERQYRVDFHSGMMSLQGDSVGGESWTFVPAWSDQPGSISGVITGTGASVVTIVASPAGSGGDVIFGDYATGGYVLGEIPGGRYTVSVFVDWNSDAVWNPGEPYGAWPGVVEVFPGIETQDIDIQVVP
ncbi:MAG: hypothetical protein B1H09_03490 [Gemmatimonadaceae bacterium 4484_173]|nr:MAG: hypothetical protein B1H09_03490 [Gemmatimonadaceae bacterium 4484_173]RKZ04591.1 MAG: hypothetical protein DRQ21_02230 [Candidatus Fermentibacteria bacterium]